jgi:uncharacterized damage-inducible protein DinB
MKFMDFRDHARYAMIAQRTFTERLLEAFTTRDDFLYQSHPQANHALWIVAHLALADNFFAARFRPEVGRKPDGWDQLFWFGSQLQTDPSVYPDHAEALAYLRDRREVLMKVFDEVTDDELLAPAPVAGERSPLAGAPNIGHAFLFVSRHEAIHGGQLTVARRGLGNAPLFGT